jgi:hypothetical protein
MNALFVTALAAALFVLLLWGIRTLPGERWQMLAAVPVAKSSDGVWRGLNLTYYGFFSASGTTFGIGMMLLLLSSVQAPAFISAALVLLLLVICVPASRLIARVVEGKRNTFTIGGAAFCAALLLPWIAIALSSITRGAVSSLAILAAAATGYALGESVGRLACLSFGCCYGLPLRDARPFLARAFRKHNLVLHGETRKAAYASGLSGEPLIPVQAISSSVLAISGLAGCALFLDGKFRLAALIPSLAVWSWRASSEWLRADYRGNSRISAYQVMAIFAAIYSTVVLLLMPAGATPLPSVAAALSHLIAVPMLLGIQGLWLALFLYYGKSRVTASTLRFHVVAENI